MGCVKHTTFRSMALFYSLVLQPSYGYMFVSFMPSWSISRWNFREMARYLISSKKFEVHLGIVPMRMRGFPMTSSLIWGESHHMTILCSSIEESLGTRLTSVRGADFNHGVWSLRGQRWSARAIQRERFRQERLDMETIQSTGTSYHLSSHIYW